MEPFCAGRYAAIEVGSNSVLLLVADVDEEGRLTPLVEKERVTRLSEKCFAGGRLQRAACDRTLSALCECLRIARRAGGQGIAAVGTSVLREAANAQEFRTQVRQECGIPIEVISGEQEAELAYQGNRFDRRLPGVDGERVVIDVGGGSTELVRGLGGEILNRTSYPLGAVRLTERYLHGDPPGVAEVDAADARIEQVLSHVELLTPSSLLLGSGGTLGALVSVARAGGLIGQGPLHATVLPHRAVAELLDLFRSVPLQFRKRIPGLDPARADVVLAGTMIVHQLMARLSAPKLVYTANGVRHGCVYSMARRALLRR